MSYVNHTNFDRAFPPPMRDEFWKRVKYAMRTYFNADERVADRYRQAIEGGSIGEQLLVYHEDPFGLAADLAGARGTMNQHFDDYQRVFPDDLLSPTLPTP
jgi:hypothetical protein